MDPLIAVFDVVTKVRALLGIVAHALPLIVMLPGEMLLIFRPPTPFPHTTCPTAKPLVLDTATVFVPVITEPVIPST